MAKKRFEGIYELGAYPKKFKDGETVLFAYLIPSNPIQARQKIIKIPNLKTIEIYEKGQLMERYVGKLPARTVRMQNAVCEFDSDTKKLVCKTDHILYMKKKSKKVEVKKPKKTIRRGRKR